MSSGSSVSSASPDGALDPHVEDVVDLGDAAHALAAVEKGHAKGQVKRRDWAAERIGRIMSPPGWKTPWP